MGKYVQWVNTDQMRNNNPPFYLVLIIVNIKTVCIRNIPPSFTTLILIYPLANSSFLIWIFVAWIAPSGLNVAAGLVARGIYCSVPPHRQTSEEVDTFGIKDYTIFYIEMPIFLQKSLKYPLNPIKDNNDIITTTTTTTATATAFSPEGDNPHNKEST